MQQIVIFNTLTNSKVPLDPIEPGHIKMYACGVTVYDHCHIGHAIQAVYFDVFRSYLEFCGYQVTYVRNYTDVDDKIINKSRKTGVLPEQLVDSMISSSIEDMTALGIRPATHEPRVSQTIDEIIAMIEKLVSYGHAYVAGNGDVYFEVQSKSDYGKLSNRRIDELMTGTRHLANSQKENPLDFVLWKRDETEGASWHSPWGRGRPGWHIECSAMAKKYLGDQFDIHGGGQDLVFPHHENEIAQSEAANQCPYATIWMHSGLLTIDQQKMSKSLGNHILIKDFLKQWPAEVLKLACLQRHYRSTTDFSQAVFKQSARRLMFYYETLEHLQRMAGPKNGEEKTEFLTEHQPEEVISSFQNAMSDDFSTVKALREIHLHLKKANELRKTVDSPQRKATAAAYLTNILYVTRALGLLQDSPKAFLKKLQSKVLEDLKMSSEEVEKLLADRISARHKKDYARADKIRDDLQTLGIELMDTSEGTQWTLGWHGE